MSDENFDLSHNEKLQAENDFLKVKLMPEHNQVKDFQPLEGWKPWLRTN